MALGVDDDLPMTGSAAGESLRRFSADELVACVACARPNGPTRMNCLYCGAPLPTEGRVAALRRPVLRKLEEWERGFNVVLVPVGAGRVSAEAAAEAESLLRLEPGRLSECVESGRPLPLARAASPEEATLIRERLTMLGFEAETVSDEALATHDPPVRVRALELTGDVLVCRAGADQREVRWDDVALFVTGRVTRKRVELEERRGVVKGKDRVVNAREVVASDDSVLDIYTRVEAEGAGWRVAANNFDYSCLSARKGLLARDNFRTLLGALRDAAPSAAFDDAYGRVRHLLSAVWPLAERTESAGLKRQGLGRFNTEAATVVSNEEQFTRYSRLCRHFALRGSGDVV